MCIGGRQQNEIEKNNGKKEKSVYIFDDLK
jgi:hypothetical protein